MNWIIIASQNFESQTQKLVNFLTNKSYVPSVYYLEEKSINNQKQFFIDLYNVTHCVIVSDGTIPENPILFYATGYLNGAKVPVFITGKPQTEDEKKLLNNFFFFETCGDLISHIECNFPEYIAQEELKKAHKKLFDMGIPFTPDCFSTYIAKAEEDVCNLFYEAGMSVDVRDAAGTPMLCIAARSGRKNMIEWLVDRGAEIDIISKDRGYSPIMDAVWKSSTEIVELLITLGADLNIVSNDGQSALIVATGSSNLKICELLVKNGADPNFKDRMGMSSLDYAKLFKKEILIPLYEEYAK